MRRVLLLVAWLVPVLAASAQATRIDARTKQVARDSSQDTRRPVVSDDGRRVVFDSTAGTLTTDFNARTRDVFVRDLGSGAIRLVSSSVDGAGGNGPSLGGAISRNGAMVAFESTASNLVEGDVNGRSDVFARVPGGPVALVSATPERAPANGDSGQVDLSEDGRVMVFSSTASDLVPGDVNGVRDVFACDLATGFIRRVSQNQSGFGGNGPSSAPAVSPDGRYISFYSEAGNLALDDTLDVPDVLLADLKDGSIRRVSLSGNGGEQNEALRPGQVQTSDVSRGGRYVVFDSNGSNLAPGDNHRHTDVFLRDMRRRETARISRVGKQADGASLAPRVSPDGRFITYASTATNLFPLKARGPNSFLYDRHSKTTTLIDVTNAGRPSDTRRSLSQRPSVSANGNVTAFTSYARLADSDPGGNADAYVRRTDPPRARLRVRDARYRVRVDDPQARLFYCRLIGRRGKLQGLCPRSASLHFLSPGRYTLYVRPWGGGMRIGSEVRRRFRRVRH